MEIFKHELYKIFINKSVRILLVLFIILNGVSFASNIYYSGIYKSIRTAYLSELEGPITEEKIDSAKKELDYFTNQRNAKGAPAQTREELFKNLLYSNIYSKHSAFQINKINVAETEKRILSTNGFDRRSGNLFIDMMGKTQKDEYYYTEGWNYSIKFIYSLGAAAMAVLILSGLSSMFSGEYGAKMDSLILSSKYGKTKLIRAKIFAGIVYIVVIDLFFNMLYLMEDLLVFGTKGWNAPMQCLTSYMNSPYYLTVLQYYFINLFIHMLACIVFGMFVMLISSLSKTQILTFFIGAAVYVIPFIVNNAIVYKTTLANLIIGFSFTWFMQVEKVFNFFRVYNILGHPVFYPVVGIFVMIIFIPLSRHYIYRNFKNQGNIM